MITTIVVSVLAVFMASIASYLRYNKGYLIISFLTILVFLALRYDFGNDYMNYLNYFKRVHSMSYKDLLDFTQYPSLVLFEFGYTWMNKLFPSFYLLVIILSIFSCYIYYYSINSYVSINWVWFSVFIYLFEPYLMLVQSSAIRQTAAICLFLYSIQYLIERKFLKYILIIILAALFHKSALILLPVYFIATPVKWGNRVLYFIFGLYFFMTFFGYTFLDDFNNFTLLYFPSYHNAYLNEIIGSSIDTGLGYIFSSLFFVFIAWSHNKGDLHNIVISKLSMLYFVLYPIGIYINMFGRIGMYFQPTLIFSLPFAISILKLWQYRALAVSIFITWFLYEYIIFFQDPLWIKKFSIYKTFLFGI